MYRFSHAEIKRNIIEIVIFSNRDTNTDVIK